MSEPASPRTGLDFLDHNDFNWSIFTRSAQVRFASFLSDGFTTMAVINPPEKKLAKCTSVEWPGKNPFWRPSAANIFILKSWILW